MKLICKLLLVGILFNNFVYSQLPSSLLGSYEVISDSGVDELIFEKERVVGKINGKPVVEYLFEKKENEYYYFKIQSLNKTVTQQTEKFVNDDEEERNVNIHSRTSENVSLQSANNKKSQNSEKLSVKTKVQVLEDNRIKLDVKYIDENGEILRGHVLIMKNKY